MKNALLEKSELIPCLILTKPEEHKKIPPELPSYCTQTLQGLYDTVGRKIAEPLLEAKNLKEKFQKLRDSFSLLRICLNSYLIYLWQEYPKEIEKLSKEGIKWVKTTTEKHAKLLLDDQTAEILLGVLELYIRLGEDFLKLAPRLVVEEFPPTLHEIAINLDLCVLSILSSLIKGQIPTKKEKQNLKILILWAKEYTLEYTRELSQFLKKQFSRSENIKLGKEFCTEKVTEFLGSGPRGVYEALLEERQRERIKGD